MAQRLSTPNLRGDAQGPPLQGSPRPLEPRARGFPLDPPGINTSVKKQSGARQIGFVDGGLPGHQKTEGVFRKMSELIFSETALRFFLCAGRTDRPAKPALPGSGLRTAKFLVHHCIRCVANKLLPVSLVLSLAQREYEFSGALFDAKRERVSLRLFHFFTLPSAAPRWSGVPR